MEKENNIRNVAILAIKQFDGYSLSASNVVKASQSSSFGIALKYVLWDKRMSFATASKLLGYKSPQGMNFLLNHRKENAFYEEEISYICKKLGINEKFLLNLSKEIKAVLNENER